MHRNAHRVVLTSAISLLLLGAACGAPSNSLTDEEGTVSQVAPVESVSYPLTLTDAIGDQVTLDGPAKVGCLWYGCNEDLADMGIAPQASAVSAGELDQQFLFAAGPPVHRIHTDSNVEEWAKADVDVIINADTRPEFEALGAAAPVFHYYSSLHGLPAGMSGIEALKENIRLLGQMTGEPAAAEDAIGRYDRFISAIAEAAPPDAVDRTVAFMYETDDGTYVLADDNQDEICESFAAAGIATCIEGPKSGQISAEEFLAIDPDWIVYSGVGSANRDDPVWGLLSAVRNGQVYDTDNWLVGESLRIVEHAMQEFANESLPDAGIPDPGSMYDFDSASSALAGDGSASSSP